MKGTKIQCHCGKGELHSLYYRDSFRKTKEQRFHIIPGFYYCNQCGDVVKIEVRSIKVPSRVYQHGDNESRFLVGINSNMLKKIKNAVKNGSLPTNFTQSQLLDFMQKNVIGSVIFANK